MSALAHDAKQRRGISEKTSRIVDAHDSELLILFAIGVKEIHLLAYRNHLCEFGGRIARSHFVFLVGSNLHSHSSWFLMDDLEVASPWH
jgi:hypothetical protein